MGSDIIEVFKRAHCSEVKVNPDEITYKITFKQHGKELDGRKFNAVCYIEERAGSFTLLSTHKRHGHTTEIKIDVVRPGG